jgi:MurNAc alpha-1-phosphate uridylyltransferase
VSTQNITHAMVMAAGFGKRMLPLTEHTPKPLINVAGKALLDYALDYLANNGVSDAVVNAHYLANQMEAHLASRASRPPRVHYSFEEEVLETAGGILFAFEHLKDAPFFSVNSDTIWRDGAGESAFARMRKAWNPDVMDALLLLQPLEKAVGYEGEGNFNVLPNGQLTTVGDLPYVFTGVQILSPSLFKGMDVRKFSLREIYQAATQNDGRLHRMHGLVHDGAWYHIGTPEGVALAEG